MARVIDRLLVTSRNLFVVSMKVYVKTIGGYHLVNVIYKCIDSVS
ncbi:circularly permuted type 2 ATP-grasp protein [Acinetobacter sp. RF15A]|nr:circularly permuted type 2 ATP-grasp protein [Acinetobacter sp. RF15A]TSI14784.1 circularly permuted type 2 ATP-grasp protein [Acinetobacter sp. RF15B]